MKKEMNVNKNNEEKLTVFRVEWKGLVDYVKAHTPTEAMIKFRKSLEFVED